MIESVRDVFSVFHFWQAALHSGNDVHHSFAHLVLPNAWSQNRFRLFAVTTVCFHQEETGKLLCVLEKYEWEERPVDKPAWRRNRKDFLTPKERGN